MNTNNIDVENLKREQKQELFESIRHFTKYLAINRLHFKEELPKKTTKIQDMLMKLYEQNYEKKKNK